jgi:hypothetical protein
VVPPRLTAMASRRRHKLDQTAFRLPEDLLAWLRQEAARKGCSMTAIVIETLEARRRVDAVSDDDDYCAEHDNYVCDVAPEAHTAN